MFCGTNGPRWPLFSTEVLKNETTNVRVVQSSARAKKSSAVRCFTTCCLPAESRISGLQNHASRNANSATCFGATPPRPPTHTRDPRDKLQCNTTIIQRSTRAIPPIVGRGRDHRRRGARRRRICNTKRQQRESSPRNASRISFTARRCCPLSAADL